MLKTKVARIITECGHQTWRKQSVVEFFPRSTSRTNPPNRTPPWSNSAAQITLTRRRLSHVPQTKATVVTNSPTNGKKTECATSRNAEIARQCGTETSLTVDLVEMCHTVKVRTQRRKQQLQTRGANILDPRRTALLSTRSATGAESTWTLAAPAATAENIPTVDQCTAKPGYGPTPATRQAQPKKLLHK